MLRPQLARLAVHVVAIRAMPQDSAADDGERLVQLRVADEYPLGTKASMDLSQCQGIHADKTTAARRQCQMSPSFVHDGEIRRESVCDLFVCPSVV